MEYLHSYTDELPACGNSGAKSKEQHCYFCEGIGVVTVQQCNALPAIVILLCKSMAL